MADSDEIFLALDEPVRGAGRRLADVLGLEFLADWRSETEELQYRGRARTFDGWIGVNIGRNYFWPEPDEPQAMDGYPIHVDVQCRHRKPDQAAETRLAFASIDWRAA